MKVLNVIIMAVLNSVVILQICERAECGDHVGHYQQVHQPPVTRH